jgi:rod shape-determining protein MreC
MKARPEATFRFAAPWRAAITRVAFLSLVMASFLLILISKAEVAIVERLRMGFLDLVAPVFDVVARPTDLIAHAIADLRELMRLRDENTRLRTEVDRLGQWQEVARRLDGENQSLRGLLNVVAEPTAKSITARVLADSGGAFVRSLLVGAGGGQGVVRGQVAMTGEGMVGRVSDVGDRTARVLLITDLNSRIPVVMEGTRDRAVLAGDNGPMPRLLYLGIDARVSPGDRVVTSGHGGALPAGLPVGVVAAVGERGILVQPLVDWTRLDYVRLLDYGLTGILSEPTGAATAAPSAVRPTSRRGER